MTTSLLLGFFLVYRGTQNLRSIDKLKVSIEAPTVHHSDALFCAPKVEAEANLTLLLSDPTQHVHACAHTHSHTHLDEFYCIFPNMILLLKNSNNFHHFHNHTLLATLERTRQRSSYTAMNKCLRTSVIVCISCRKWYPTFLDKITWDISYLGEEV